jgi:hypothetical protein
MTLTPAAFDLLWPTFALVLLIFVMWFTMVVQRLGHIKRNPPSARDFADNESSGRYFSPVEMASNNFRNLFEMPVLFFVVVLLLLGTRQADYAQVVLAWAYVGFRALHSLIHIGPKNVRTRFMVYLASCAILSAMWIGLFVDLLHAASVLASVE